MPNATLSSEPEHFNLKSCPGGYVKLRRMSYGEWLSRRQMAAQMKIQSRGGSKDFESEMDLANRKVTEMEFKNCIVEHNLADASDALLDFRNPSVAFLKLDPRIGQEIGDLIDKLHNFDEETEQEGNSSAELEAL